MIKQLAFEKLADEIKSSILVSEFIKISEVSISLSERMSNSLVIEVT